MPTLSRICFEADRYPVSAVAAAVPALAWIGAQRLRAGKAGRWFAVLPGVAILSLLLAACAAPPAEQALRSTLASMQETLEQREPGRFMASVAEDFAGRDGLDHAQLGRLVRLSLLQNQAISVTTGPLDIQMIGTRATVRFSAVTTGGSGRFAIDRAGGYQVDTAWRFDDGEWLLISADWH